MSKRQPTTTPLRRSKVQQVSAVFWPSFVLAGIANSVYFSFIDPLLIASELGFDQISGMGMYSLGFFGFWALTLCSSACTQYLLRPVYNSHRLRQGADSE